VARGAPREYPALGNPGLQAARSGLDSSIVPELPEVETVTRIVRPKLVGRTIEDVHVSWPRTLGGRSPAAFRRAVVGARVRAVWRRAKYLVFDLERGGELAGWIVGHLRMTGRIHVEPRGYDAGPYERLRLELDRGKDFHFIDTRKFGRLVFTTDLEDVLPPLGPEPLGDEFTVRGLHAEASRRRRLLKPLLLDQSFVAGLGNIYVDECLHLARLHPERRSDRLDRAGAERLHDAIRRTLAAAIEREGSSFDSFYRTPEGNPGSYQHQFRVYGRTGLPCPECGEPIRRIVVAGRGTHLCPRCQGRRSPRRPFVGS